MYFTLYWIQRGDKREENSREFCKSKFAKKYNNVRNGKKIK